MPRALVIAAVLGLCGCVLHFSDDTACPDGVDPAGGSLVNPSTLECQDFDEPADCSTFDPNVPTWGACESTCSTLDEAACLNRPGCRGAYDHDCLFGTGPCPALTAFLGCFATDVNQDFITPCDGLDAWNCSRHEQCFSTHRTIPSCRDGIDQDADGTPDDADECGVGFVRCLAESSPV